MSTLEDFVLARLDEEEEAVKTRDLNRPIHFVGCYYYDNSFDSGLHCDCMKDEPEELKKQLEIVQSKRDVVRCLTEPDRGLLVAILAKPYVDHPDFPR